MILPTLSEQKNKMSRKESTFFSARTNQKKQRKKIEILMQPSQIMIQLRKVRLQILLKLLTILLEEDR
jgi:hypothetical protein